MMNLIKRNNFLDVPLVELFLFFLKNGTEELFQKVIFFFFFDIFLVKINTFYSIVNHIIYLKYPLKKYKILLFPISTNF